MTAMAPEAPPAAAPAQGRGNVFTRRIGPLPMWVWLVIGAALIAGYVVFRKRQSSSSSSAGGTTSAAQVPQFVNQTYTTVQPPLVPSPLSAPGSPWPVDKPPGVPGGVGERTFTVPRAMTLEQFAKSRHWTETTLAAVEKLNNLAPGAKLKKGQKIKRPWAPQQPGQPPLPA